MDELEADFQQYYNLDVALVHPARAARLMFQLPRDCRLYTKIEPANQWGFHEIFLNKMVFYLETLVWQNGYNPKQKAAHKAAKPHLFIPDFLKRPGIDEGKETHTVDEIKAILERPRT